MSSFISETERLSLNKLIREMDSVDNTEYIRNAKQSGKIAHDINTMEAIKKQCAWRYDEPERFVELCKGSCKYLFNNYTDIFNKLIKDEINLSIMGQFLLQLSLIENGDISQHEGSVIVGRLLKDLYLDSAIRRGNNLDKEHETPENNTGIAISWKEFKDSKK
jgi:hypothetical protein